MLQAWKIAGTDWVYFGSRSVLYTACQGIIGRGIRWCNIDLSCSRCIRGVNTDLGWQLKKWNLGCQRGNGLEAMDVRMCRKTKTCRFYSEYKSCMYA